MLKDHAFAYELEYSFVRWLWGRGVSPAADVARDIHIRGIHGLMVSIQCIRIDETRKEAVESNSN